MLVSVAAIPAPLKSFATAASTRATSAPHAMPFMPRQKPGQKISDMMARLSGQVAPQRRMVHAGDVIYQAGERFGHLYILNSGFFKIVNLSADGREQVVSLKFRGDWLGFDGIADGHYVCDAVAMETGEVWGFRYDELLCACAVQPMLLAVLHEAMSREIAHDRDSLMSVCTLPADARVAEFLRHWVESLTERGMRTDEITLCMTRAEIGNYLGMTLESVSRALTRLARDKIIAFARKGRREVRIPDADALSAFVQRCIAPVPTSKPSLVH